MIRLTAVISGRKVQNVGYRLFLLELMKMNGITGFAANVRTGKHVSIEAWGEKKKLLQFYQDAISKKPRFAQDISITDPVFDQEKPPANSRVLNEKLDLMIEQLSKTVKGGIDIKNLLGSMNKNFSSLPKRIAAEMKA